MHPTSTSRAKLRVAELFARQHGVISRAQARSLGLSNRQIGLLVSAGEWRRVLPQVFRHAAQAPTWGQQLMAVSLWAGPGSAASHRSAGHLWGLCEVPAVPEITTTRNLRVPHRIARVHRSGAVDPSDVTRRGPFAVTRPERTLIDLAGILPFDRAEKALDDGLRRHLTAIARLAGKVEALNGSRTAGVAAIRLMLAERPMGTVIPDSHLETRALRWIAQEGLPPPDRQVRIHVDGRFTGRVDLFYDARRVIVEVESYTHHHGRQAWEHDLARRNDLEGGGNRVLHVTSRQIDRRDPGFIKALRRLLDE